MTDITGPAFRGEFHAALANDFPVTSRQIFLRNGPVIGRKSVIRAKGFAEAEFAVPAWIPTPGATPEDPTCNSRTMLGHGSFGRNVIVGI